MKALFTWGISLAVAVAARPSCSAGGDCLQAGTPESVGLLGKPLQEMKSNITAYSDAANYSSATHNAVRPIQPGGAVSVGHKNTIVSSFAFGYASLYNDANGTKLPARDRLLAKEDTIYDLASLTKLFTTIAVLRGIDAGLLALNGRVASYIPAFATNGKENVTVKMLLTHTSGFDADPAPPLYDPIYKTEQQRRTAIIQSPLKDAPGTAYTYSDINFMTLMILLENTSGKRLYELVGEYTSKLGMTDTFFNRGNIGSASFAPYPRMAAQEFQIDVVGNSVPKRPQPVRGTVHDENAFALEGVSGHAGLFSTIKDISIFCQMILNNGTYGGERILKTETVGLIFYNFNSKFPEDAHGLGFELNQRYWSGPMASLHTAGHTGFTGTSLVIDRPTNTFFILLANRVHPSRLWSSNNIVRQALGYWVARSLGRDVAFP